MKDQLYYKRLSSIAILIIFTLSVIVLYRHNEPEEEGIAAIATEQVKEQSTPRELFDFDPNSANYSTFRKLGLPKTLAVSIIRYRSAGKIFHIKEDLATCYGMTDSIYAALEPHITIADSLKYKKRSYNTQYPSQRNTPRKFNLPSEPFAIDTVSANYLAANTPLTLRQAEVLVKWRGLIGGIRNIDQLAECYVVSDTVLATLRPYVIFADSTSNEPTNTLVDINKATAEELEKVYGIGETTSQRIVEYRQKLGGFYSVNQIAEVEGVLESNFLKILQQISCNDSDISKIDINFANSNALKGHPYISKSSLRKLTKRKALKGGYSTKEELENDNIFTSQEMERLAPYLIFRGANN